MSPRQGIAEIKKTNSQVIRLLEIATGNLAVLDGLSKAYFSKELDQSYIEEMLTNVGLLLSRARQEDKELQP